MKQVIESIPYKKTFAVIILIILCLLTLWLVVEITDELFFDTDDGYHITGDDYSSYEYQGVVWEDVPLRAVPEAIRTQIDRPIISVERFKNTQEVYVYEVYTLPPIDAYFLEDGTVIYD